MKTLPESFARCSGRYNFYTTDVCPDRETCMRYQAFRFLDSEAGIEHYRAIGVMMAIKNCEMKIDVEDVE